MTKKYLYPIWGGMYVLCAALGTIPQRSGAGQTVLTVISLLFFVPGFWLLGEAVVNQDKKQLKNLRIISGVILGLTVLALIGNILSVVGSLTLGDVLYVVLSLVSAPMMCCKYWALILFIWAAFFIATFPRIWWKKPKKS